jgi:hypothetical protein
VVPAGWTREASARTDEKVRAMLEDYFGARQDVRDGPYDIMSWVIVHAVEGAVEAAVIHRPELLSDPKFRMELSRLIARYLTPDDAPQPDSSRNVWHPSPPNT